MKSFKILIIVAAIFLTFLGISQANASPASLASGGAKSIGCGTALQIGQAAGWLRATSTENITCGAIDTVWNCAGAGMGDVAGCAYSYLTFMCAVQHINNCFTNSSGLTEEQMEDQKFLQCLGSNVSTQNPQWATCVSQNPQAFEPQIIKQQEQQDQQNTRDNPSTISDCAPNSENNPPVKNNGSKCYCTYTKDGSTNKVPVAPWDPNGSADMNADALIGSGCNVNDRSTQQQADAIGAATGH